MLNLNKIGRPLCVIKGGQYSNQVISVSDAFAENTDDTKEFMQLKIANDSDYQQVPDSTKDQEILYITGPSESAKAPTPERT